MHLFIRVAPFQDHHIFGVMDDSIVAGFRIKITQGEHAVDDIKRKDVRDWADGSQARWDV